MTAQRRTRITSEINRTASFVDNVVTFLGGFRLLELYFKIEQRFSRLQVYDLTSALYDLTRIPAVILAAGVLQEFDRFMRGSFWRVCSASIIAQSSLRWWNPNTKAALEYVAYRFGCCQIAFLISTKVDTRKQQLSALPRRRQASIPPFP